MSEPTGNLLLDVLSAEVRQQIVAVSRPVELPLRLTLHEQGEFPVYAYFPQSGIASMVVSMRQGGSAEVGLVGREGLVGATHLLGPIPSAAQSFIQLDGKGLRMRMDDLRSLFRSSDELRGRILEFIQQNTATLQQIAACNKLHEAEMRLARWLMMSRDRADDDTMHLTQEFLAVMLGTRRATVTLVASSLQRRGLISYRRGKVTILSREKLEQAACDCYALTKQSLLNLYKQA